MANNTNFPAISRQVTELVLSGSSVHAEEAINETAEQFGDLAVVAVLDTLEPQVAAMHLSSFDGGKLSLATLLISPRAWAQSLAFFAATWSEDQIEDEPEVLTESLFAHVHGVPCSCQGAQPPVSVRFRRCLQPEPSARQAIRRSIPRRSLLRRGGDDLQIGSGSADRLHPAPPTCRARGQGRQRRRSCPYRKAFSCFAGRLRCHNQCRQKERSQNRNGVPRWFYAPCRRVKQAIEDGKLGQPILGSVTMYGWRDEAYYKRSVAEPLGSRRRRRPGQPGAAPA